MMTNGLLLGFFKQDYLLVSIMLHFSEVVRYVHIDIHFPFQKERLL